MKKAFLKLLVTSGICLAASSLKAQNLLVVNNGFENGKTGWSYSAADVQLVNDEGYKSKASLKIISRPGNYTYLYTEPKTQKLSLNAGKKYELKIWVKPLTALREVELRVYSVSGFKAGEDFQQVVKTKNLKVGEWQELVIPFSSKDYAEAKFSLAVGIGEVLFDDVTLVEVK